jgi:hypothetical protein
MKPQAKIIAIGGDEVVVTFASLCTDGERMLEIACAEEYVRFDLSDAGEARKVWRSITDEKSLSLALFGKDDLFANG